MERITAHELQKSIKGTPILHSADLSVESGEICALIGPNGVGKTTLIKCILGLAYLEYGTVQINGTILSTITQAEIALNIGAVLQYPASISSLTVDQLFLEHFHYLGLKIPNSWNEYLRKVGLSVPTGMQIGKMSLGMKQRLLLAVALAHTPNILILDEPFNGLDVDGIVLIKDILKELSNNKVSILVASHSLSELEDVATSVVFMLDGKTRTKKDVKDILREYEGGLHQYYQHIKKGGQ